MRWPFSRLGGTPPALTLDQVREVTSEVVRAEVSQIASFAKVSEEHQGWPYHLDNPFQFWVTFSPRKLPGKSYSVDSLRSWAKNFDPLRAIIEYLKAEAASVPIKFVAKKGQEYKDCQNQIDEMQFFVGNEGPLGKKNTRRTFEARLFEDLLVVGAYSVWYQYARGGLLLDCDTIDAATIKPRVDSHGWPDENQPFEQWVMGVLVAQFKPGEIRYDGMFPRTDTPYFDSAVEYGVSRVTAGLQLDNWNLSWLTEGNVRTGDTIALPQEWTPLQVIEFSDWWNSKGGGSAQSRQGTSFLPSGSTKISDHSRKDQDFAEFEVQVIRRLCSVFGVMPASIGYVGEQYKVTQGDAMDHSRRVGLGRMLAVRKEFYDDLCIRLGYDYIECINVEDDLDEFAKEVDVAVKACGGPCMTVDEVRGRLGLGPMTTEQKNEIQPVPTEPNEGTKQSDSAIGRADGDIVGWFRKNGKSIPITEKSAIGRAARLASEIHKDGGCTVSLRDGNMSGKRFCSVSIYREREQIIEGVDLEPAIINDFISDNREFLLREGHVFGSWVEGGNSYLDVSILVATREEALELCLLHRQDAYYDLETGEVVYSGYDRTKEDL